MGVRIQSELGVQIETEYAIVTSAGYIRIRNMPRLQMSARFPAMLLMQY
jgi:hypothetical protein